jgi:prophage regulatory protein
MQMQEEVNFLSEKEVSRKVRLSRAQIWRLRRMGRFPVPISISDRRIVFLDSEIDAWMRERVAARNQR